MIRAFRWSRAVSDRNIRRILALDRSQLKERVHVENVGAMHYWPRHGRRISVARRASDIRREHQRRNLRRDYQLTSLYGWAG